MAMPENDTDQIAQAIKALAVHVKYLGVGDAATTMGAIEFLATKVDESGTGIAEALGALATAVQEVAEAMKATNGKLNEIADAIEDAASKPWEGAPR
jgi:methyl-accepting chemotaxis protein